MNLVWISVSPFVWFASTPVASLYARLVCLQESTFNANRHTVYNNWPSHVQSPGSVSEKVFGKI